MVPALGQYTVFSVSCVGFRVLVFAVLGLRPAMHTVIGSALAVWSVHQHVEKYSATSRALFASPKR